MRKDVHVLAMSATPVPRTLQLSLAGVRDLSIIETPPRDQNGRGDGHSCPSSRSSSARLMEYRDRAAAARSTIVYNRVETISSASRRILRETGPRPVRVTVGHGQLDERELARRMHAFGSAASISLLLATTIIENGIDIPNVNTMIVHQCRPLRALAALPAARPGGAQRPARLLLSPDTRATRVLSAGGAPATRRDPRVHRARRRLPCSGPRSRDPRCRQPPRSAEQSGQHRGGGDRGTYLKLLAGDAVAELKGEKPRRGQPLPSVNARPADSAWAIPPRTTSATPIYASRIYQPPGIG